MTSNPLRRSIQLFRSSAVLCSDKIRSTYDQLVGVGAHRRMTDSEYNLLRKHSEHMAPGDMRKLLGIARIYDVSADRRRLMSSIKSVGKKERSYGERSRCLLNLFSAH